MAADTAVHGLGSKRPRASALAEPVCSNLMTVPGVGPITALSFYSAIGDPSRFQRTHDVGPYFGLTPSIHQSGVLARVGRISRFGNTHFDRPITLVGASLPQLPGQMGRAKSYAERLFVFPQIGPLLPAQHWRTRSRQKIATSRTTPSHRSCR